VNVGTVIPIRKALRPGEGSVSSIALSSTPPVEAEDVSMSGDWPVTVTFSEIAPTSSVMSMVTNCCVPTITPLDSYVL
jgi:hypothetical protein